MTRPSVEIILLGTEPGTNQSGVSTALVGFMAVFAKQGIPHRMIPTHSLGTWTGKFLPWLLALPRLVGAAINSRKRGVQLVVYAHAGALPSLIRKLGMLTIARCLGAKAILHLHAIHVDRYLHHPLKRHWFLSALRHMDLICVLTPWWEQRLLAAGFGGRLAVVPNPISDDLERATRCPREPGHTERITILAMTRLVPGKGVDVAIQAISHLPDEYHLLIAGDGPERARLERLVQDLGLQGRVDFLGWVGGDDKKALLRRSDVFCLPSTFDSFGMGYIEAMAFGVPVVAVSQGPIPDVVPDGVAGRLVSVPEAILVAQALQELEAMELRHRIGNDVQQLVREKYSRDSVGLAFGKALERIWLS